MRPYITQKSQNVLKTLLCIENSNINIRQKCQVFTVFVFELQQNKKIV